MLERAASFHGDVKDWYSYEPVTGVAVAACACFAIGLVIHLWQMIRHKAWIWCVMVIAVGSTWTSRHLISVVVFVGGT